MIEVLKDFPDNVAAFACHGHITKQDYATVLVPAVEQALKPPISLASIRARHGRTQRSASVIC